MTTSNGSAGKLDCLIKLASVILGMLGLLIVSIGVIAVYPFNPIDYTSVDMPVKTVKAGETIKYTVHFNKHTSRTGAMTRYLKSRNGDSTIILDPSGFADSAILDTHKTVVVEIPRSASPGKYYIQWTVLYDYFGIRQVKAVRITPDFEVTN